MTATRERAINLRDWEARANQAGRLKMLVRPVKPQPNNPEVFGYSPIWGSCVPTEYTPGVRSGSIPAKCVGRYTVHAATNENGQRVDRWIACPYGKPGDRLRGRETWALVNADEDGIDDWVDMGPIPNQLPWPGWQVWHRAGHSWAYDHPDDRGFRWRSAITMPRWTVRNWLEITEVRCGRVREMSEEEAWMTGVEQTPGTYTADFAFHGFRDSHSKHYDADHGAGAWERDWVWMIGVKRIEGGV